MVFGNHAPGGACPYYAASQCFHCDIGAGEGAAFDHAANRQRLAWFHDHYRPHLDSVSHLVLYNSGSILNPREMPPEDARRDHRFRPLTPARFASSRSIRARSYIKPAPLRRIVSVVAKKVAVRPILGIESADEHIRNEVLRKAMSRRAIDRVFHDLGTLAADLGPGRIGLDVNIVIAGPGTSPENAVDDAVITARSCLIAGVEMALTLT